MWGSWGSRKVLEGPGIPEGRKSQPEVSELYRTLLECHVMTWGVFWGFLEGLIGSWWLLRGSGGYWRLGSFFQGPICLLRFWRAGRFREGTKRVSGGSDGSENLNSLLEYHIMTWRIFWRFQEGLIRSIISQGLIFFNNAKSKFDLKVSPVLLLCQKTLSTRFVPFYVSFQMNGVVGP